MDSQRLRYQLLYLSQKVIPRLREVHDVKMQSDPNQASFEERSNSLLDEAITFWEAGEESRQLNDALKRVEDQTRNIVKIFAFGLPNIPDSSALENGHTPSGFEELTSSQRSPYLYHAALISLQKVLAFPRGGTPAIETHSLDYTLRTEFLLRGRGLHVHASHAIAKHLDELGQRVDERTLVFAPGTNEHIRMYIKYKSKAMPAGMVWRPSGTSVRDTEVWFLGEGDRWTSSIDETVQQEYTRLLDVQESELGPYEVIVKKD